MRIDELQSLYPTENQRVHMGAVVMLSFQWILSSATPISCWHYSALMPQKQCYRQRVSILVRIYCSAAVPTALHISYTTSLW